MAKFNEENERIKRAYFAYLTNAEGYDEATLDKVAGALHEMETALGFKPFKAFHREWAVIFKKHLAQRRNAKTGQPLGVATKDSHLRLVKAFFHWLASQPGYKSRITYADVRYFNNLAKDARAAHAERPSRYPSLAQCDHAFRLMSAETLVQRRDRGLFATWMLTAARAGALASFRLKHIDLVEGVVYQDGREVKTKGSKSFETWFFPVDPMYRACLSEWMLELTEDRLFGPDDALFPKQMIAFSSEGRVAKLDRDPYANAQIVNKVIGNAFRAVNMHPFNPHSIRKTMAMLGDRRCTTMAERKAWSQNLGHENLATTVSAYMPVDRERQAELIKAMAERV